MLLALVTRRSGRVSGQTWSRPRRVLRGVRTLPRSLAAGNSRRFDPGYAARVDVEAAERGVCLIERWLLRPRVGLAAPGLARGWVGERTEVLLDRFPAGAWLELDGLHHPHGDAHRVLALSLSADGHALARFEVREEGLFRLRLPLPAGLVPPVRVAIEAAPAFVPDEVLGNGDRRRLCFMLERLATAPA